MFKIKEDYRNRIVCAQINNLLINNKRGIRKAFYFMGKGMETRTKALILEPKHGKLYRLTVRGKRINHIASAPGEAPANLSGDLRKSIGFYVSGDDRMEFGAWGGDGNPRSKNKTKVGVEYGKFLELGTRYMSPREFLAKVIKEKHKDNINFMKRELMKEFKK